MKRILIDGHVLDGDPQGTTTYIVEMAKELAKVHEVYVACLCYSSFQSYFNDSDNVIYCQLNFKNKYLRMIFDFFRLSKKFSIDYSVFQYMSPLFVYGKTVVVIHDVIFLDFPRLFSLPYRLSKGFLYFISAWRADYVVTVSEYSKNRICSWFKLDYEKVITTPNAVNILKFKNQTPISKLLNKQFFLYVSRIEPRKNHRVLIQALSELESSDAYLVFAGSTTIDAGLDDVLACSSLKDRILFLRPSDSELGWLYSNALAHFYPSLCEGFGIPPLEAAVLGAKSFVASNTALIELEPYVDGFFRSEDVQKIRRLMEFSLSDSSRCDFRNKEELILSDFSWRESAGKLLDGILRG